MYVTWTYEEKLIGQLNKDFILSKNIIYFNNIIGTYSRVYYDIRKEFYYYIVRQEFRGLAVWCRCSL